MESSEQDLARAKQYYAYAIKIQGGHDFDDFFGECQCGVVFDYWKSAMAYRLEHLFVHGVLPVYDSAICKYSEA